MTDLVHIIKVKCVLTVVNSLMRCSALVFPPCPGPFMVIMLFKSRPSTKCSAPFTSFLVTLVHVT